MDILNNFGVQPTLLFGQIVNFLIILFLLKKFFYGKITGALEDRKKKIEESLKNADTIELKLKETEEKSTKIIADSQAQAQEIIKEAKAQAEEIAKNAAADAQRSIQEATLSAQVQIQAEREKMKEELQEETLTLVTEVVKKVLGRTLKPTERQSLTKQALSDVVRKLE